MNNRYKWLNIFLCICAFLFLMFYRNPDRPITMHLGVFVGSNFDVYNDNSYATLDQAIKMFEEKHPNVTIKYESGIVKKDYSNWLSQKILEGEELDAFMVLDSDFNTLASIGALENLNKRMYEDLTNSFYKPILEKATYEGKLYALPYEVSPMMMCVNKDLLEKNGIEMPKDDWTVDDFYRICEKVTKDTDGDGDIDQYGCYNFDWKQILACYGLSIFSKDGSQCTIDDRVKEALQMAQRINTLNNHTDYSGEDFDSGIVAFCPMSIAEYRTYQPYPYRISKYTNFSWSCLTMPGTQENDDSTMAVSSMMAVHSRSSNKDLAFEFVKMLASDQSLQESALVNNKGLSVQKSIINSDFAKTVFENEALEINPKQIDNVLTHLTVEPRFKKYNEASNYADYLISQAFESNSIESELATIKESLESRLK